MKNEMQGTNLVKGLVRYCGRIIIHEGREARPYPRNGNRGDSVIER